MSLGLRIVIVGSVAFENQRGPSPTHSFLSQSYTDTIISQGHTCLCQEAHDVLPACPLWCWQTVHSGVTSY